MLPLNSISVFCGSSSGAHPAYAEAARTLGAALAESHIRLVYGAGNVGLMGILADAVLAAGGSVIGVIPRFLARRELAHREISEFHEVETMHERKAMMMQLADAFVALPGGIGTLEEFFEVWTWVQLGLMNKPIGILNVENLFNPLLTFMDTLVEQRFVKSEHHNLLVVTECPHDLLKRLRETDYPAQARPTNSN